MDARSLGILRSRRDIACVLVNPLQGLHPNRAAPGDSSLLDSGRSAGFDRAACTAWLQELRQVCTERGIVLIFDEVFVGFRIAPGGAQEYFGVQADMVTWGKTLGGGLPVGVVCGKASLMRRYRDERPADICFARGTFNSHPAVMGAMNVFLERLATPAVQAVYAGLDERWNARVAAFNTRMEAEGIPLRAANMSSIWTLFFTAPSRYNWMLQFYLREQGLALSWVGTGRLILPINMDDATFSTVMERMLGACHSMKSEGWWWDGATESNRDIRRSVLRDAFFGV